MNDELPTEVPVSRHDLPTVTDTRNQHRHAYVAWMDRIDDELIGGALVVAEALPRVTAAFHAGDRAIVAQARAMAADVGERVRYVEEQGFLLIAREAPVGADLRRIVSILRLITAVERSAALTRHVAELLERIDPTTLPAPVRQQADELGGRASDVYRRGVDSWRNRDGLAVSDLDLADEAVDRLAADLVGHADQLSDAADLMALGLLARYWERIADHGVAFAQHNTFAVTGERVEVGR